LLLWHGNLIKAVLRPAAYETCHQGNIEAVHVDSNMNAIFTAGQDGIIRAWNLKEVLTQPAAVSASWRMFACRVSV
jgi:hypothetical protein